MLRPLLVLAVVGFAAAAPSQSPAKPQQHLLWPDGAPNALGTAPKDRPHLVPYLQVKDAPTDADLPCVVICPGGGYGHLAMDHEGHQIAAWLNGIGIRAVILNYRHRGTGYAHPAPLQDAQRAVRTVRHHAAEWHIDAKKVGVLGFSAGGHLASSVSVHHDAGDSRADDQVERQSCRPDFAVLCYAVLAFGQDFTHRGSQRNLLGKQPADELVRHMSSELQVRATTPPTFLWHTTADRAVPAKNSIVYYLALQQHNVPCELHLFEAGRHGIGLGKGLPAAAWAKLCEHWLQGRGVLQDRDAAK